MYTSEITKGVDMHLLSTDKFQSVSMCILLRLPLKRETATANALLASAFMQGCSKYKSRRLIELRLEEIDSVITSDIVKKGEEHIIELYVRTMPFFFDEVTELVGNIMLKPLFHNIESCKKELESVINSLINDKRGYALEKCIENMCEKEAYGVRGDGYAEDINNVSIHNHYTEVIENAKVDIIIVGNIKAEEAEESIKRHIPLSPRETRLEPCNYLYYPVSLKDIGEKMDITQGKLCMGLRMNIDPVSEEWYKAIVANDLFGGSASSALFMKARESESLCYYITSKLLRFKSIMIIEAGIDSENKDKIVEIINSALENISEEDIETSKRNIIEIYKISQDKPEKIMDSYLGGLIAGKTVDFKEAIEAVGRVKSVKGIFKDCQSDTLFMLAKEES